MNKLMFVAAGVAVAGSAFADPLVYDYKASVKHIYLKEVKPFSYKDGGAKAQLKYGIYQKIQKSASLKGYLIVDADGATSQTISKDLNTWKPDVWANDNPAKAFPSGAVDQGRNRAFLVVMNNSAEKQVKHAKILPAVLESKWIDAKAAGTDANDSPIYQKSGIAEGYLFVGGDYCATGTRVPVVTRPKTDLLYNEAYDSDAGLPSSTTIKEREDDKPNPMLAAFADYGWTSIYLFGKFNGPNWNNMNNGGMWKNIQDAIDKTQPIPFQTARNDADKVGPFYHDTWLNHGGIGKWKLLSDSSDEWHCCGMGGDDYTEWSWKVLESLSGNLKGGIFICSENGYSIQPYKTLLGVLWEDQFFTQYSKSGYQTTADWFNQTEEPTYVVAGDINQLDLWQDGLIELNTTDVAYGTWSIKLVSSSKVPADVTLGNTDKMALSGLYEYEYVYGDETVDGEQVLNDTIFSCAKKLDKNVKFLDKTNFANGEIYNILIKNQYDVPFISPSFWLYYGLGNFTKD